MLSGIFRVVGNTEVIDAVNFAQRLAAPGLSANLTLGFLEVALDLGRNCDGRSRKYRGTLKLREISS
jgi:hypothetical protein